MNAAASMLPGRGTIPKLQDLRRGERGQRRKRPIRVDKRRIDGEQPPQEPPLDIVGPHREDLWLMERLAEDGRSYGIADARNCTSDQWLEEGDKVAVGEVEFDTLHCPGHTPGHLVFVNTDIKFGIFGDVLFQGSIGRTDFPRGDHAALINAIKTKILPLGDDVFFICGHGPASSVGHERQTNPFLS